MFEPCDSPISQRIAALQELHEAEIETYAFLGPILPGITDLPAIFASLEGIVDYVYGETLNTHCGNMPEILRAVTTLDRRLRPDFDRNIRNRAYWESVEEEFKNLAKKHRIEVAGFFYHVKVGACS